MALRSDPSAEDLPSTITISAEEARLVASSGAFSPGELVAGRYEVRRRIGQGGMGAVYEVADRELNGEVIALKTILPGSDPSGIALQRFRREVVYARRVTHPNICRTFDVGFHSQVDVRGTYGTVIFVTMEYLDGETLLSRIQRTSRIDLPTAQHVALQITDGVAAAQAVGVIHRDLKSSNIVIIGEGAATRAVIMDFGIARLAETGAAGDSLTGSGLLVGSPAYMAPEQVEGGAITPATDVYALGIVLFEMVTGRRPFEGSTPMAMALRRLSHAAPSPKEFHRSLPYDWEAVILRCLERDPKRRYADARSLQAAIAAIGRTQPAVAAPTATRNIRPRTSHAVRIAIIVFAVIAIALVALTTWLLLDKQRKGDLSAAVTTYAAVAAIATDTASVTATTISGEPEPAKVEPQPREKQSPETNPSDKPPDELFEDSGGSSPPEAQSDSVDSNSVYMAVPPGGTQPEEVDRAIPRYPAVARQNGTAGAAVVRGIVRIDGSITDVQVIKDLPDGLGEEARVAVSKWRFRPATYRGRPINVYYTVTVNFRFQ